MSKSLDFYTVTPQMDGKPKSKAKGRARRKHLTPKKMAAALLHLNGVAQDDACEKAGFARSTYKDVFADPLVREFMESHQEAVKTELAKQEAKALVKVVSRESILERLWELANLAPEDTNGNITGQVKACDTAAEMLGGKVHLSADLTKDFYGRSDEELEFFAQHGYWPMDAKSAGTA